MNGKLKRSNVWRLTRRVGALLALFTVCLVGWSLAQAPNSASEFVKVKPADVHWTGTAGGMQTAILEGNPSRPGPYVMRVKFPAGTMTRPHFHSQDRFVTVIAGTWHAGTGEQFMPERAEPMPAGSYMKHPAHAAHFDGAKDEECIVQIIGMGPVTTEYLNPADNPASKSK